MIEFLHSAQYSSIISSSVYSLETRKAHQWNINKITMIIIINLTDCFLLFLLGFWCKIKPNGPFCCDIHSVALMIKDWVLFWFNHYVQNVIKWHITAQITKIRKDSNNLVVTSEAYVTSYIYGRYRLKCNQYLKIHW